MRLELTFITCFSICFSLSYGQSELNIIKSENSKLVHVLNNSKLIGENSENYLAAKIYSIDDGTASAGMASSEASYNLLVSVSEFDEEPEQSLFEIGTFYNPRFVKWVFVNKYEKEFEIEHGVYTDRRTIKLRVNIRELFLIN